MTNTGRKNRRSEDKSASHLAILSLEVTGGWMEGAHVELSDRYTCLIGPNGSGKTTTIEAMCFAFGDSKVGQPLSRNEQSPFQQRLGHGSVRVRVRTRNGVIYTVQRAWGERMQIFDERGSAVAADLVRDLGFAPEAYGHFELQRIAVDPARMLGIVDHSVQEKSLALEDAIAKAKEELASNATKLLLIDRGTSGSRAAAEGFEEATEAVEKLGEETGPEAARLDEAHVEKARREQERTKVEKLPTYLRELRTDLEALAADGSRRLDGWIDEEMATGTNVETLGPLARRLRDMAEQLTQSANEFARSAQAAEAALSMTARALGSHHAKQEAEYQALLAKSKEALGRAKDRADALRRLETAKAAAKEVATGARARAERAEERKTLWEKLTKLRLERFEQRTAIAARWTARLKGRVEMRITPEKDRREYERLLEVALKSQGIRGVQEVTRQLVERVMPEELVQHVERREVDRLMQRASIDRAQAERVIDALTATEALYKIHVVEIHDEPALYLLKDGKPTSSEQLSMGERCAAVLPLLLVSSDQPLLVDEPEGNLSQFFLSETLARSLREIDGSRQYVFATHSASIPVVGQADLVVYMEGNATRTGFVKSGSVEELRVEIERHCDGGPKAFEERRKLYGH